MEETILRPQAEQRYRDVLAALRLWDRDNRKPQNWQLSPKAVRLFLLGSPRPVRCGNQEITIRKKYLGNDALVERCIITLAGNRGLMLAGEPGTAKTMLSELLSAAISGCSTNTVQGTAGTTEDMIKYSFSGRPGPLLPGPAPQLAPEGGAEECCSCYYPFLDHSPELAALRGAARRGIPGRFMDLPYGEILLATRDARGLRTREEKLSYASDRYLAANRFQRLLCEKICAGTPERCGKSTL